MRVRSGTDLEYCLLDYALIERGQPDPGLYAQYIASSFDAQRFDVKSSTDRLFLVLRPEFGLEGSHPQRLAANEGKRQSYRYPVSPSPGGQFPTPLYTRGANSPGHLRRIER